VKHWGPIKKNRPNKKKNSADARASTSELRSEARPAGYMLKVHIDIDGQCREGADLTCKARKVD
jgi:hypothetical protein